MRKFLVALSLCSALALPSTALAEGGPGAIDAFRKAHEEVTTLVDADGKQSDVQAKVDGLLDYDWIATAALGGPKRYAERCADQCDRFKDLLTRLIRANYLKRIDNKDRGSVEYVTEHVREKATKVDTKVTFTDPDGKTKTVEIDYVMHKVEGHWHVRDIITDGVSLAKNYKYEINKLYKDGGMDKVITSLENKIEQLETDAPAEPPEVKAPGK